MLRKKPLVLVILDGWGCRDENSNNAIALAKTPHWDAWWAKYPHTLLKASGSNVGLPAAQMGNSEVGHMHIGAGRIILQDLSRINAAIDSKDFFQNPVFISCIEELKQTNHALHIMGLLSKGGVHSHEDQLFAFLKLCHLKNFSNIYLHLFLDGRDTAPQSALASIRKLENYLTENNLGRIASISGRYFAMDRDKRWDRVAKVYEVLTKGESLYQFKDAESAIRYFYEQQIFDEFIPPTIIGDKVKISESDSIFFFNFRADRARQLTEAFLQEDFSGFSRELKPKLTKFISMTSYGDYLATEAAFLPQTFNNTLGEVIAKANLSQLRIAETEKYAHVTFFFNGGSEQISVNEKQMLIPSPKVATYDLMPEMSAPALTDALISAINYELYDVIICNYANADMVGHTGNLEATIRAIECLDKCLGELHKAIAEKSGIMLITADHGNAETMFSEASHQKHTAHTSNPVPFLCLSEDARFIQEKGSLIDVAPTILALLNIPQPQEMTGKSLLMEDYANQD